MSRRLARALAGALLLGLLAAAAPRAQQPPSWEETLARVARGVVVLRLSVPRAFDTQGPAASVATGFVVDAREGLILTNRHVVQPGPVVAEGVFLDHEEVPLRAVYRDPVHDFGFFRYDPEAVRFMEVAELDLRPDLARVGTEIRVVGNDAGEKLSILTGTLARLDRDAPNYGRGRYGDFNTFYYQAASSTSGGSSGSPVVDVHGHVVALNAGGSRRASSSFYLPLDRIVRALEKIRSGEEVPRGTLQSVFLHRPFDELRRLGLRAETEAGVRQERPDETGMLVVLEVVPGGPADDRLQVGDVLVRVDGELVTAFTPLEAALDERVGGEVELLLERAGRPLELRVPVQDLHAITPDEYLEFGGGVVNPLSYQLARSHGVSVEGLYVASGGYAFSRAGIGRGTVITHLAGEPVPDLETLEARLAALPQGARTAIRSFQLSDPKATSVTVLSVDRRWFPMARCRRDDRSGRWPCLPSPPAPEAEPGEGLGVRFADAPDSRARTLQPSLALVTFDVPYRVAGVHGEHFTGTGVVVDAERGLVLVDRETVPVAVGDATLTFASAIEVPAEVEFLHPIHNFAVLSYDPTRLGDTPVRSARLADSPLRPGDRTWLVGFDETHSLRALQTRIALQAPVALGIWDPPRFRQSNLELLHAASSVHTVGGVLADAKGRVAALWAAFSNEDSEGNTNTFFAGIPASRLAEVVGPLRDGRPVEWRSLGAELWPIPLVEARARGLSDASAMAVARGNGRPRRLLEVDRVDAGTPAAALLEEGDLLLAVDAIRAPNLAEVEQAGRGESVALRLLRDGAEVAVEVPTTPLDGRGTDRFVSWAGAVLHEPHRALSMQKGIERTGVYVAWFWYGSPANRHRLRATSRIVAVDDVPTPDLDSFLAAVAGRADRSPVRLRTLDLEGTEEVVTLKLDLDYWPTAEFRRSDRGWERRELPRS